MVRYIADSEEDLKTLQEPPPTAYLTLMVKGRLSHTFPLRGELQLGREKGNAIVVADQKVSRHHASMIPIDDTFILSDLGSANGTYINGVSIAQPTRLKNNDQIGIGDTTFLFTHHQPDADSFNHSPPPVIAAPKALPEPAAGINISSDTLPVWVLFGCMGLVIIALLFLLAVLVGLFIGQANLLSLAGQL